MVLAAGLGLRMRPLTPAARQAGAAGAQPPPAALDAGTARARTASREVVDQPAPPARHRARAVGERTAASACACAIRASARILGTGGGPAPAPALLRRRAVPARERRRRLRLRPHAPAAAAPRLGRPGHAGAEGRTRTRGATGRSSPAPAGASARWPGCRAARAAGRPCSPACTCWIPRCSTACRRAPPTSCATSTRRWSPRASGSWGCACGARGTISASPSLYLASQLSMLSRGFRGLAQALARPPRGPVHPRARVTRSVVGPGRWWRRGPRWRGSVLWDRVRGGRGARVRGSILATGGRVAARAQVRRR